MKTYPYIKIDTPSTLPVSLSDMKLFLKIDDNTDDDLIAELISISTLFVENYTHRELITKEFKTLRDGFFDDSRADRMGICNNYSFVILKTPFQSVVSIKYLKDDVWTLVDSSIYYATIENYYSYIRLKENQSWPTDVDDRFQSIEIRFKAGYGIEAESVTRATNIVTVTTLNDHYYSTGDKILIAGADPDVSPADFNGSYTITVTGEKTFTYANTGNNKSAAGNITANKIPYELLQAIKMIAAFFYANRGDCTFATITEQLRATGALSSAKTILDIYKILDITVP